MTHRPATATTQTPSGWIISPVWDIVFFLGTPLLALIPALTVDVSRFDSTQLLLLLAVVANGHHVPGFIRAYSDPELMAKYRGRMLLGPVLLIAAAVWMQFEQIAGMELLLIVWGVWHFLMQDYGLMRIYGVKKGEISSRTALLDWLMMLSWILTAYLNNPAWSYKLQRQIYELGVPFLPHFVFPGLGALMAGAAVVISVVYVAHAIGQARRGEPANPLKYVLLLTTLIFFVAAFNLTRRILFVTIMVELVHDLQYYALGWVFQRRLSQRHGAARSWLRMLFHPTPAMLLLFVLICLLYGVALSDYGNMYLYEGSTAARVTTALLIAATIFHFYTDGFIWKVRQARTREYLGIEGKSPEKSPGQRALPREPVREPVVWRRSLVHLACYAGIMVVFVAANQNRQDRSFEISKTLAQHIPQLGDAHHTLGFEYQKQGRAAEAVHEYAQAIALGVDKPIELRQRMAWAFESLGQYEQTRQILRETLDQAPADKIQQVAGQFAIFLAECPRPEFRNGEEAVSLAEFACPESGPTRALHLDILAASYLEAGRPADAARAAGEALREARARGQTELVRQIEARLRGINQRNASPLLSP